MLKRTLFAVLTLAGAARLDAQWSTLPDGSPQYTANYAISSVFSCPLDPFSPNVCDFIANGVRINSGTAWADITFVGTGGPVAASNTYSQFLLGTYTLTMGGTGPFSWPLPQPVPGLPLFVSQIQATISVPSAVSGGIGGFGFIRTNQSVLTNNCCQTIPSYGLFPFTAQPVGLSYTHVAISVIPTLSFDPTTPGSRNVYANISLVPEPSTYALMAAGLVALALIRRRSFGPRSSDPLPA